MRCHSEGAKRPKNLLPASMQSVLEILRPVGSDAVLSLPKK